MKRACLMTCCLALLAAGAWGAGSAGKPPATRPAERALTWEDYQVIVTRNMFSKDRIRSRYSSYVPSSRPSYSTRPRYGEERPGLVLTGIGRVDEQRVAFFEDINSGASYRIWPGQILDKGTVMTITLDSVTYVRNGTALRIEIGQNLSGATPTLPPPAASGEVSSGEASTGSSGASPGTQPSSETAGAASAPAGAASSVKPAADSLEERMKQRRAKELGQ